MRLSVAAAGNAEKNINIINARFQAEALRQLRGYDTGVLVNSFFSSADPTGEKRSQNGGFMWKLTASTVSDIAVGRGMATAYGFDIQSEETVHLTATAPSAGSKYLFIYLEWDFSNPEEAFGKIDIRDNGSSSSWTPSRRDNLITNPIGAYQMILYRLQVNTAGRITATTKWDELGVTSIEWPLFALNCKNATNAKYAEYATGKTDRTLKEQLEEIYRRLEALGFKTGTISGTGGGSIVSSSLKKQGKYVLLTAVIRISGGNGVAGGFKIDDPAFFPKEDVFFTVVPSQGRTDVRGVHLRTDGRVDDLSYTTDKGQTTQVPIYNLGWETE